MHYPSAVFDRERRDLRSDARCGRGRFSEHALAVNVFDGRIEHFSAILASDADYREFVLKRDKRLNDQIRCAKRFESPPDLRLFADYHLTLSVIAEPPRLEHGRQSDPGHRRPQIVQTVDRREIGSWNVQRAKKLLLQ